MSARTASLQRRLLLSISAAIAIAALVALGAIGYSLFHFARGQIDQRLDAQLQAVEAALEIGADGRLRLTRIIDGPPFDRELSGWYWQARPLAGGESVRSPSLNRADLIASGPADARRNDPGRAHPIDVQGPGTAQLVGRFRQTEIAARSGVRAGVLLIATAPRRAVFAPVIDVGRILVFVLLALFAALFATVLLQIRQGLRPLERIREALIDIRAGRIDRLPEEQPPEVRPLALEINNLLSENSETLSRSRMHVANLAHSLKTPLSTLALAFRDSDGAGGQQARNAIELIDRRISHHLRRARTAALAGGSRSRTPLAERVAELSSALSKIYQDKNIVFDSRIDAALQLACDPLDVDEIFGNLLDNACKWCASRVRMTASAEQMAIISIEDDGEGIPADAVANVLKPGERLDETAPGSGFGLGIAAEIIGLYGGTIEFARSELGGLRVDVSLPAAPGGARTSRAD
ncbi:MAG: hypothetical protein BGP06_15145 [Rhizobiales bacterium 65-9]|nr:MAG: hypothetical protein BGP06_15145 [Rhizobiales bacterium 65-9]